MFQRCCKNGSNLFLIMLQILIKYILVKAGTHLVDEFKFDAHILLINDNGDADDDDDGIGDNHSHGQTDCDGLPSAVGRLSTLGRRLLQLGLLFQSLLKS